MLKRRLKLYEYLTHSVKESKSPPPEREARKATCLIAIETARQCVFG